MNREIKFRGWCETDDCAGKMIYFDKLECDNGLWFGYSEEHINEHFALMQYTGLKDKNGKEIFEGDILNNTHYNFNYPNTILMQQVYFNEGCFCAKSIKENIDELESSKNNVPLFWLKQPSCMEVIGNIYENPQLLENGS